MHLKLLLIFQLLLLGLSHIQAYEENEDATQPTEAGTPPELMEEEQATAVPESDLEQMDEGLSQTQTATTLPETTIPTTETTTTTAAPKTEPYGKIGFPVPQYPLPYPHPYGYGPAGAWGGPGYQFTRYPGFPGVSGNPAAPAAPGSLPSASSPDPSSSPETPDASTPANPDKPSYPGAPVFPGASTYPYPSYPRLRPPFSPYGSPLYPQFERTPQFPYFAPDQEKPKPADQLSKDSSEKTQESSQAPAKTPGEAPPFGYPPVYVIRRPLLPGYPYSRPIGGYGVPFGYGR